MMTINNDDENGDNDNGDDNLTMMMEIVLV